MHTMLDRGAIFQGCYEIYGASGACAGSRGQFEQETHELESRRPCESDAEQIDKRNAKEKVGRGLQGRREKVSGGSRRGKCDYKETPTE